MAHSVLLIQFYLDLIFSFLLLSFSMRALFPALFLNVAFFPLEWILVSLSLRIRRAQINSALSQYRDSTMHSLAIKLCESLSVLTVTTNWLPNSLVTICWLFCIPQVHQLPHFFLLHRCWQWSCLIINCLWIVLTHNPEYSLEVLMLKLKLQYFGYMIQRADSFEKTLMLGKIEDGRRRG